MTYAQAMKRFQYKLHTDRLRFKLLIKHKHPCRLGQVLKYFESVIFYTSADAITEKDIKKSDKTTIG